MREPLGKDVLARIARAGLLLPRSAFPGQAWKPRTVNEEHLLRQARALDLMRRQLLGEVTRLQASVGVLYGQNKLLKARATREVDASPVVVTQSPTAALVDRLTPAELETVVSGAMGETIEDFANRTCVNVNTAKTRRRRAMQHLQAETFAQAVAMVAAAGKADGVLSGTGAAP